MLFAAALLFLPAPTGQVVSDGVIDVAEAERAVDGRTRKGEVIRVRGFLSKECYNTSCSLLANRGDWDGPVVSLAGDTTIEPQLRARRGKLIVLRARINEPSIRALPDGTIIASTDRAPELIPIAIEE